MEDDLSEKNREFINGANINIDVKAINIIGIPPKIYNPPLFQTHILIEFYQKKRIIRPILYALYVVNIVN